MCHTKYHITYYRYIHSMYPTYLITYIYIYILHIDLYMYSILCVYTFYVHTAVSLSGICCEKSALSCSQ